MIRSLFYKSTIVRNVNRMILSPGKININISNIVVKFQASTRGKAWQSMVTKCNAKLTILAELFAKQCHFVATQRIIRTAQLVNLYSKIYDEKTLKEMVAKLCYQFLRNSKGKPVCLMFAACMFQWDKEHISEKEIESCVNDMTHVTHLKDPSNVHYMDLWECIIDKDHFKVWRKPIEDSYLYEYKVYGTFNDVAPRSFFAVQIDLEYRKKWDKRAIHIDCIDRDNKSGSEVVRWVTNYTYPMYSREYVYVRRTKIDIKNNTMVLIARSTDHPDCPVSDQYVRVTSYSTEMVILPHTTFDENGLDYILTYQDDPQGAFPKSVYSWLTKGGIPTFVDDLHNAALNINTNNSKRRGQYDHHTDSKSKQKISGYTLHREDSQTVLS